jgi:transcriptional regulator
MFIPNIYSISDTKVISEFILKNSFATIISVNDIKRPNGSHIPLELEIDIHGETALYGHVAKGNVIGSEIVSNPNVLCIFQGPHTYVSSGWYGHENVPTWNYMAVHIYGKADILNEDEKYISLQKLMQKYEKGRPNEQKIENYSSNTMRQLKGIVAFKIRIEEMQCVFKLSQNRNEADYRSVIHHLRLENNPLAHFISDEMEKLLIQKGRNLTTTTFTFF